MNTLRVRLNRDHPAFRPGDRISVQVGWALDDAPESIAVRLFWYTEGKGDQDVGIADEQVFETPPAEHLTEVHFTAPAHPASFDGKLISILWAVEVTAEPSGDTDRVSLVISPLGAPLSTDGHEDA